MLTASMSHIGHAIVEELDGTLAGQWGLVLIDRLRLEAATAFAQDEDAVVKTANDVIVSGVNELVNLLPAGVAQSHARWALTLVSGVIIDDSGEQPF